MAPEVITYGGYGAPADIWSFGCTMIEMATGKPPFIELGLPEAAIFKVGMHKIHPPIPEHLSEIAKNFIKSCFHPDPSERPSASTLLAHQFIHQYSSHSNRTIASKKRLDNSDKPQSKFFRSASHLSGMSLNAATFNAKSAQSASPVADTIPENLPGSSLSCSTQTRCKLIEKGGKGNEKNLRLKIEPPHMQHAGESTQQSQQPYSLFKLSQSSLYLPNGNVSEAHLTNSTLSYIPKNSPLALQPTSPIKSPLSASPSLSEPCPFMGTSPSTSGVLDENCFGNQFFTLQKETERRSMLTSILSHNKDQIIEKWYEQLIGEIKQDELMIDRSMLVEILREIQSFFGSKDCTSQQNISRIWINIDPDRGQKSFDQLTVSLCLFPNAVQPLLKLQGIKPHWMFTLDDLIRNAIQQILRYLHPDKVQLRAYEENQMIECTQSERNINILPHKELFISSNTHTPTLELGSLFQHKLCNERIKSLHDNLIAVENKYRKMLEHTLDAARDHLRVFKFLKALSNETSQTCDVTQLKSNREDNEPLKEWLLKIGADSESISLLEKETYTKHDLIDFVSRRELLKIGIKGGQSCLIWRHILKVRLEFSTEECNSLNCLMPEQIQNDQGICEKVEK